MSTPKYLAQETSSRTWPCSMYEKFEDFLEVVTCTTWHLEGLNSMYHRTPTCADPGIFVRGVQVSLTKKALTTFFFFFFFFFLVLSLFYRSRMVGFKEIYQFSRIRGGGGRSNIGGGSNCLFHIETHITCDFPGGGVRTPCPPLWIRTFPTLKVCPGLVVACYCHPYLLLLGKRPYRPRIDVL